MAADFLGRGWKFPVDRDKDDASHIALTEAASNIEDSIWIILATAAGERVMRPDFGCGIHRLVFAVNDSETIGLVKQEVHDALVRWEPRIDVLDIGVETKGRGEVLLINIQYRVRVTNNFFNLVFPFYLSGSVA
ncbi:MAG: GPW/gp25 family protein [Bryobacteraceae bacterium]